MRVSSQSHAGREALLVEHEGGCLTSLVQHAGRSLPALVAVPVELVEDTGGEEHGAYLCILQHRIFLVADTVVWCGLCKNIVISASPILSTLGVPHMTVL